VLDEESLVLTAHPDALESIHAALDRFRIRAIDSAPPATSTNTWLKFSTAVVEIATNIIRYAYPNGRGEMGMRLRFFPNRLEARLCDRGVVFKGFSAYEHDLHTDDMSEGGRGLAIALKGLDRLFYRRTLQGTNCWGLIKRF
jgi:anti-sigma regulatory factor (Ser/Thr protein kinase)